MIPPGTTCLPPGAGGGGTTILHPAQAAFNARGAGQRLREVLRADVVEDARLAVFVAVRGAFVEGGALACEVAGVFAARADVARGARLATEAAAGAPDASAAEAL